MEIQALGYLVTGTSRLEDWTSLATRGLGMEAVDRSAGTRAFRMDDRKQRLVLDSAVPEGLHYFGWEVEDAAALDALAGRLEQAGVAVRREPAAVADQRFVSGLISFRDPAGNRLEAFHGAAVAATPFRPSRLISGFRAGPLGMGHVLVTVQDMTASLAFYRDLLGFRISDYSLAPVKAYFLHVNPRHHSIALVEAPVNAMNHLMVELYSLDDVGQGYDLALMDREKIVATLGRHYNDLMTSFYMRTPSEFFVEYGWGGRDVDDATWQPEELKSLASFWGHDGLFRAVGAEDPPPNDLRPNAHALRAPLQVIDGNYQRMQGVCPWWDAIKARARQ
ncbi:MAG TPA: VOC family protein [Xanthobacteraceae bacterium]|nr:VOC family protein [Xanthobacteraceae bacterium]